MPSDAGGGCDRSSVKGANVHAHAVVLAAICVSHVAPSNAQDFVLSTNVQPSGTSVFADETGVYIPCSVRAPKSDPIRYLTLLHFDGTGFSSVGSEQIFASRVPCGGESMARAADGTLFLRGHFDVDGWPTPCLAARVGETWTIVQSGDANPFELVSVGEKVFAIGQRPKANPKSNSGLFALREGGKVWEDRGLSVMYGKRQEPGAVNDVSLVGNKMYLAGYFNSIAGRPCRDIVEFDASTGAWTAIEPPYPPPAVNSLGAVGEPQGTSNVLVVTPRGSIFWSGAHRKTFGYNDRALAVRENGHWRILGKVEDDRGQLHSLRLVRSGDSVFAIGSFDTLLGEKCSGFAKWNGTRFVAAGKKPGIWSTPAAPKTGPMSQWTVRDRQFVEVTGDWPGKIVVIGKSEFQRESSPLAVFDVAADEWVEVRAGLRD